MTWASQEFRRVVKKNQNVELPRNLKIAIGFVVVFSVAFVGFSTYSVWNDLYAEKERLIALILYLLLCGAVVNYIRNSTKGQLTQITYVNQIRNRLVAGVKRDMEQLQLPLDRVADSIQKDLQEELARIQKENQRYIDFMKKVWTGIVCAPCAFLLALFFQAIFSEELLKEWNNMISAMDLLLQLFFVLCICAALVTVIYIPASDGIKYVTGENQVQNCLDVLEEIRISELCTDAAPEGNSRANHGTQT